MLQHYSKVLPTYSNRYHVANENQPIYSTQYEQTTMDNSYDSYYNSGAQQLGCPTSHVPPLLSSVLCSNNYNFSIFSGDDDLSMISPNDKYSMDQLLPQTLTADELQSIITSKPTSCRSRSTTPLTDQGNKHSSRARRSNKKKGGATSLMDLSRRLRTNLSLAKQRMMTDLKQSTEPSDLAMYTRLENITLEDSASPPPSSPLSKSMTMELKPRVVTSGGIITKTVGNGNNLFRQSTLYSMDSRTTLKAHDNNKYRVHKKKPYNSCSSYMELQTNPNGYVSVVLRKSSSSAKDSYSTLTRSFSFNVPDSDSDSDSDSDGEPLKDTMMDDVAPFDHSSVDSWSIPDQNDGMMLDVGELSPTWMQDLELLLQQQQFCHPIDGLEQSGTEVLNENNIDSWLQRGGLGCSPIVAATDQELADLLDFD